MRSIIELIGQLIALGVVALIALFSVSPYVLCAVALWMIFHK